MRSVQQAAASESVISEAGEQLLQEDSDRDLEATRFITRQEARTYISDLEKDRANLWKKVNGLEASLKEVERQGEVWGHSEEYT